MQPAAWSRSLPDRGTGAPGAPAGPRVRPPFFGTPKPAGAGWIFAYVAIQFACQFALLTKALAPARVVFRSSAFGASLLFLLLVPGSSRSSHVVRTMAAVIMVIVTLSALNPTGGAPLAVFAHWSMYLAVLGPLFWVARLDVGEKTLERLLLILWGFHTLSSTVGLLQVFFPGEFQPAITVFIQERNALMIRLASGEWVIRPMGLTDAPGGAAGSGLYAALIGMGVVLTRPIPAARTLGMLSMTIGLTCIYLAQVRSALVMLGICFIVLVALLALSERITRTVWLLLTGAAVVFMAFELAFDLGGQGMVDRMATLVQTDPGTVYRKNRGIMIEEALTTLVPEYPFGAGLARWGMMNLYFGRRDDDIGAEVQWVAWILDGGILLAITYSAALLTVTAYAMRTSLKPSLGRRESWAAIVAAYDVGALALCFSYVPFMSTNGLEVWLLNAVLIQAVRSEPVTALARA